MNLIQVYATSANADEETIEKFYGDLDTEIRSIHNRKMILISGDFNAKIGRTAEDDHIRNVVGKYGIGERNDRGSRLIQFCLENEFTIANPTFKRRLYT